MGPAWYRRAVSDAGDGGWADAQPWGPRDWIALAVVLAIATACVLVALGGGAMRTYDEGLYGRLARNALAHGEYLFAVDASGEYFASFSKPPLSTDLAAASLATLGVSLTSLRLPFALAMILLVAVCFAWGRRIGGLRLAIGWAGVLTTSAATFRWGRVACIEPMLMAFVVAGLWAYHEALSRRGASSQRWAIASGVALTLAFFTKQLVVGIAALPILAIEIWRRDGRAAWSRLALALGIPALSGATWLIAVRGRVGGAITEVLWSTGVVERVEGFDNGHNLRSLNEISGILGEALDPWAWPLGIAGLVVLVLRRPPRRRAADGALLLPLLLLGVALVYENASQSMLPWYAFDFVPALAGGLGVLVAAVLPSTLDGPASGGDGTPPGSEPGASSDALELAARLGGIAVLGLGAVAALRGVASQIDAAIVLAFLVAIATMETGRMRNRARAAALALSTIAIAAGTLRRPELWRLPDGHEVLMRELAARGITDIAVDRDASLDGDHDRITYYGPASRRVKRPPWSDTPAEAYVTGTQWPSELPLPDGVEILRAPGATAIVGAGKKPVWEAGTVTELLASGLMTFEAEHARGDPDTLARDPEASGGMVRQRVPFRGEVLENQPLSLGPDLRLPAGKYRADFWLEWSCGDVAERTAAVVQVVAGSKKIAKREVECDADGGRGPEAVSLKFSMGRADEIELRVLYRFGRVRHDRTVVVAQSARPKPAPD